MTYFINQNGYYFAINDAVDTSLLKGQVAKSLEELYELAAEKNGLLVADIECTEFIINKGLLYDDRGCTSGEKIVDLEAYLNSFVL
ncbi:hypothetical protein [Neptuniibacter sp. QD37_11]|uniref:hypothetical protein n=1 Tax=Neptuniibacter sp. QD37_11 TaxID=3398209 RepID=UPI0039F604BA